MAGGSSAELRERIARLEALIGLPKEGEEAVTIAARIDGLQVQLQNLQELIEERINAANEKVDGVDKDMGILADLNQSEKKAVKAPAQVELMFLRPIVEECNSSRVERGEQPVERRCR
ncbi:hypothetical protein LguiB_002313 [Lonicera macranthoides]